MRAFAALLLLILLPVYLAGCTGPAPRAEVASAAKAIQWEDSWTPIHGGFYPRLTQLRNGALVATFDLKTGGQSVIGVVRSEDGGRTWSEFVPAAAHAESDDVANAFPLQLRDGSLVVAYRHHSPDQGIYRIELRASSDGGASWEDRGTIARGGVGLWEPFLLELPDQTLQAYYASEEWIHPDQRIEMRASSDGGRTWGAPVVVAQNRASRDGMPGVVRLSNGTLFVVFEASDHPPYLFVIRAVRSGDNGLSWSRDRTLIYHPTNVLATRWSAGAPSVVELGAGRLLVSFQTDEDVAYVADSSTDPTQADYAYIQHTRFKYVASDDNGRTWGAAVPLTAEKHVPALWNALYLRSPHLLYAVAGFDGRTWLRRGVILRGDK